MYIVQGCSWVLLEKYRFLPNVKISYICDYVCLTSSNRIRCVVRLTLRRRGMELIHFGLLPVTF